MTFTVGAPSVAGKFVAVLSDRGLAELHFPDYREGFTAGAASLPATQRR